MHAPCLEEMLVALAPPPPLLQIPKGTQQAKHIVRSRSVREGRISGFHSRSLEKQESPQIEVEIFAAAVVALQFLQFIFCRERFRRNHWLLQAGAWAAYYMPLPLSTFAVGAMLQFRCPYWLVAIFFAAGHADCMAAYSLDDDPRNVRRFAKRTLTFAYLTLGLLQGVLYQRPMELYCLVLSFLVCFTDQKISSMKMTPSSDICVVAAEGANKSQPPPTFPGGTQARRTIAAVGSLESHRSAMLGCTTYEEITDLNYPTGLEDVGLASALFLQLLQRFHTPRHTIYSSSVNLIFSNLLMARKSRDRDYTRALKLVEVQLCFLYDYFFSTHGSPSWILTRLYVGYSVLKIGFVLVILSLVYSNEEGVAGPELGISVFAIYALLLLELYQLVNHLTSNWAIVSYLCELARNSRHDGTSKSYFIQILGAIFGTRGSQESSWQNKLGQYSLIEDFRSASLKQQGFMARLQLGRPNRGTTAISPVALSDEMKIWVIDKVVNPKPSRLKSLSEKKRRSPNELPWTFRHETEIHTILIWHIATWYCAKTEETRLYRNNEVLSSPEFRVSTKLSSYCAYLVAFHPELLPGHHTMTASIVDKALEEVELDLSGETTSDQRYTKMRTWSLQGSSDQAIPKLGVKLGQQLMDMDDCSYGRWKIMADLWVEMLQLVAQSDNATAHTEHLAKGGEFVTHIWAFLSNAGIQRERYSHFIRQDKGGGQC
ncbi:unnamed protein product [Urochloa decumbens]|uniref:DUF4220 domain-containing protein n=1 Tax=Urochloa decumbens TaxID=240449 RepID=A0ABC8WLR9_9POAL